MMDTGPDESALAFISQKVFIKSFFKSQFLHKSVDLSFITAYKGPVGGFVRESTSAKQLYEHFL